MDIKQIGKNQIEITIEDKRILQSYNTVVAMIDNTHAYVTEIYYSSTTTKHINRFLGTMIAEKKPQSFFDALLEE